MRAVGTQKCPRRDTHDQRRDERLEKLRETTMTEIETQLRERLRTVKDPQLESDIISLGLVEDIRVTDSGVAEITLAFNAPYAPDEIAMGDRIREVVAELGLDTSLSVSLSWHDPDSPLPDVRNVVAVASGKGGVGKTTVATNLAASLAETGARVGLLDADIYGPNVPQVIGIEGEPGLRDDGTLVPPEAYGIKVVSMAFLSQEETDPAMLRGPMIDNILTQLIKDVEWGSLDYLVVDLPPGTGDAQLTLMQTVPVTGAVVVTTPEDIALEDVRKGIRMFEDHGTPILGVVENMSGFECPSCGDYHDLYGSGGGQTVASEYDAPLLTEIPMIPEIRAGNDDEGPPVALQDGAKHPFEPLAEAVTNRVGAVNRAEAAGVDPDDPAGRSNSPSETYLDGPPEADKLSRETPSDAADSGDSTQAEPVHDGNSPAEKAESPDTDDADEQSADDDNSDDSNPTGGLDITE